MQDESDLIVVGKLVGVYGVKGWFKVMSYTRPKENLLTYRHWQISKGGKQQKLKVLQSKAQGKGLIASLEGIEDRDEALLLVGSEVSIQKEQLPKLDVGEFYWSELLKLQVVNEQDEVLGVVTQLLETGANDVLVVETEKQRHLIPYVKDVYIKDIDIEKGVIRVDWQADY